MQLTRQASRRARPVLNMAPMIDVVFLLLIFFMCTSSFQLSESEIPTDLPQAGAGAGDEADDFDSVRIRVKGHGDGVLVTCDGTPCVDFKDLTQRLRARRALGDLPVVIQGDGAVPYEYMVGALDACREADLKRVAFAAKGG